MNQLSFEILVNPSVPTEDELRLSRQAHRLYRLFLSAYRTGLFVSNLQMAEVGLLYQSRLYELRRALIPCGWCVDLVKKGDKGLCFYQLVRLEKSTFFAQHKERL
jgi:hypothetical protein